MCQQRHDQQGHQLQRQEQEQEHPRSIDPFPWHAGVFDAHCHPTDTISSIESIPAMRTRALTVMATRSQDQSLVDQVAKSHGLQRQDDLASAKDRKIIPCFGWHPWFSYQLYDDSGITESTYDPNSSDEAAKTAHYGAVLAPSPKDSDFVAGLPSPVALSTYLSETRAHLEAHTLALIGEIGLDKAFRLPRQWLEGEQASRDETLTPGGREGRLLSPYRVRMPHQQTILKAQLALAGEMGRAVSVHGVQAHGILFDTLASCWKGHEREVISRRKRRMVAPNAEDDEDDEAREVGGKPYPPRICLHSFSGTAEVVKQYLNPAVPAKIFFSFSKAINLSTEAGRLKVDEVVKTVPDDRIVIESDLHTAGDTMDDMLEEMYRKVCDIKGWDLEDGARRIGRNYEKFIFG